MRIERCRKRGAKREASVCKCVAFIDIDINIYVLVNKNIMIKEVVFIQMTTSTLGPWTVLILAGFE